MARKLPKGVNFAEGARIASWVQAHELPNKQVTMIPDNISIEQIMEWFKFYGWEESDTAKLGFKRKAKKKLK